MKRTAVFLFAAAGMWLAGCARDTTLFMTYNCEPIGATPLETDPDRPNKNVGNCPVTLQYPITKAGGRAPGVGVDVRC